MRCILPVIVVAQFCCTSLWFAGNAILPDIILRFQLQPAFLAHITSAVQFGFIAGALVFALLTIADRFSPSRVFFISAIFAALFNLAIVLEVVQPTGLLLLRFLTGFFLAGIYPVGMKIASDHYQQGLGKSLGFLVGALVIGTAFPHFLKSFAGNFAWHTVVYATSAFAFSGGVIMLLWVPDGPFRKPGQRVNFTSFLSGFRNKNFRSVAIGYFGHMWELYSFWAFVPVMLNTYNSCYRQAGLDVPLWSFVIIGSGALSCVFSGLFSQRFGAKKIASIALFLSGLCCMLSPFFLFIPVAWLLIVFLLFWGLVVIADSPLFSTLVAQNAPAESRGASLTIVNCIGFSITIISIQTINLLANYIGQKYVYMVLAAGPFIGLIVLLNNIPLISSADDSLRRSIKKIQ